MIRLFIALPIEEEAVSSLSDVFNILNQKESILKVVPPKNYHITLKFLGNCDEDRALSIEKSFDDILLHTKEIPYTFSGIGTFPNLKKARVIWCGLKTDYNSINHQYKLVEDFAFNHGFKREGRDFIPHLTIARVRKGALLTNDLIHYIKGNRDTHYGNHSFQRLVLYSSMLSQKGPIYTERKMITFA